MRINNMFNLRMRNGFTLIELIVVISIISVLTAIAVPILFSQIERARIATHNANVSTLKSAAAVAIATNGIPDLNITWPNADESIDPGFKPNLFITEWPDLPDGLPYTAGFPSGSTTSYEVRINAGGTIDVSPAKIA